VFDHQMNIMMSPQQIRLAYKSNILNAFSDTIEFQ